MPVVNVSWEEVQQYVGWLSRLTGKEYRLLTEAEWEYAARAASNMRFSWGNELGADNASCSDCGSTWSLQTAPVGSFKPNAFGLHDVHGNVWEWVEDSWHENYQGAPTDGSA
jgi:formylglycine-generating enzyme required for sulfatase activity